MSNATMTMTAATRPFALIDGADASWCGEIAGYSTAAMPLSQHRVRLIDAVPAPNTGRGANVGTKQGRPPRGEPR